MLVNLAYLLNQPTGTTTYALNLLPHLAQLDPCFLATPASGLAHYTPVPTNLTAEYGMGGHVRRLLWTQFQIPAIYHQQTRSQRAASLLFSPITEAPLGTRCRFVVTVHDLIPLRFPTLSRPLTWLYRHYVPRVLAAAEHIICNSQATADDIIQSYGIRAQKITPILLAYDAQHFQPLGLIRHNYFLVLGRHAPYKNIATAISAFAKLPPKHPYELWIAGPPDARYTPQLQTQIQTLGLTHQVKFLDYVSYHQLPILLNQALALVFPSLWEGFGLPALEAMACGTPVIASNLASIPEVTSDAAILIDPHCDQALMAAMATIIHDDACRKQLSQAGLQRAEQFSWQATGQATVAVLRNSL
ncbi:MAG: glycosyltransferase family 4 protein [Leptolyngbya sp. SIO1E4]|nr:glycosyltransferase family 4 protein [Leptolyngbya sp. SIO1E4]